MSLADGIGAHEAEQPATAHDFVPRRAVMDSRTGKYLSFHVGPGEFAIGVFGRQDAKSLAITQLTEAQSCSIFSDDTLKFAEDLADPFSSRMFHFPDSIPI
ncbi:MAG TPA: hypothetical protein VG273_10530 [Bryobacteraceae bacterium]|nr:hypothetical protein [Bryobacteraceae bacterium]